MQRNLRLDRLGDGTDLVDLEEETVARLLLDGSLDAERVGDRQVISDDLDAALRGEVGPRLPVVLVERIFDGDNGVFLDEANVDIGQLLTGDPLTRIRVRVLEVQVVLAILVEFGRCNIECNLYFTLITGFLNSFGEKFKRLLRTANIRCKSTLITNVYSYTGNTSIKAHNFVYIYHAPSIPYFALMTFLRLW